MAVNIARFFMAKRRIDQGITELVINIIKFPVVFSAVNTRYHLAPNYAQDRIMELATKPMSEDDAQMIMELLP